MHLCVKLKTAINAFYHFGKILSTGSNRKAYKAEWFDNSCRNAKTNFMNAKRNFDVNPTHENRAVFVNERCKYSKIKRRCKRNFYDNEKEKISEMSKKSPRKFWKYIKRYRKKDAGDTDVSLDEFYDYFKGLTEQQNRRGVTIPETNSTELTEITQLDEPFSIREIEQVIKSLKRSKSADLDNNVADFFIDSCDFICPYLCTLFNVIFESGSYPDAWSKGVIVPIFKKGDRKNPANYRGITIVNITAKIFSLCLRNRINKWCESEHIFNEQQYGFREN